MDASEYTEYIISMLFLKRVNDQFEVHRDRRRKTLTEVRGINDPAIIYGELERQNAPEDINGKVKIKTKLRNMALI